MVHASMVWYGMVWYGMVWYGMVWYGMVWYGMVWYGMVWYGMVWYGMVWYIPWLHYHRSTVKFRNILTSVVDHSMQLVQQAVRIKTIRPELYYHLFCFRKSEVLSEVASRSEPFLSLPPSLPPSLSSSSHSRCKPHQHPWQAPIPQSKLMSSDVWGNFAAYASRHVCKYQPHAFPFSCSTDEYLSNPGIL